MKRITDEDGVLFREQSLFNMGFYLGMGFLFAQLVFAIIVFSILYVLYHEAF